MYLFKFRLENNTEPFSVFECLNSEVLKFNHQVDMIKLDHPNEKFYIACKNEVIEFQNADELMSRCEFIELSKDEYEVLTKLRIGMGDCAAQNVFKSVHDGVITYDQAQGFGMEM